MPLTNFPYGITSFGIPVVGNGVAPIIPTQGHYWFVDGTSGSDAYEGTSPDRAFATIGAAITAASKQDTIFIFPKEVAATDTDPGSYAEALTITTPMLSLIGVSRGKTQGGLPQIKKGSGTAALLTIRAPECLIANLGFNGGGSTGGGILLDDDGSTKTAWGTTIVGCHFKNCVGPTATNGATGGAVQLKGAPWQVRVSDCVFYKNVADVTCIGNSVTDPQDLVIERNHFSGPAASVDVNIYLHGTLGLGGLVIDSNTFPCWPALSSGTNVMCVSLTGSTGSLTNNMFGCVGKTFGAAGDNLVPTTVRMAGNYQEPAAGASGEIGRT